MADNYYGTCGFCGHMHLDDKFNGKFYCDYYRKYWVVTEKQCNRFERDNSRTNESIERARTGGW